jgi:hypothetical protein
LLRQSVFGRILAMSLAEIWQKSVEQPSRPRSRTKKSRVWYSENDDHVGAVSDRASKESSCPHSTDELVI